MALKGNTVINRRPRPRVFLSCSIPDTTRWDGAFDPLEITDAVTALGRAILASGGAIVTAAHPTIAPLLLYIAAEFPRTEDADIIIYQSEVYEGVLPASTRRFEESNAGLIVRTRKVGSESPQPGMATESLRLMRRQMLREQSPSAAVFIGGMEGILEEFSMFRSLCPEAPTYALGCPGGEAATLVQESPPNLVRLLESGDSYPFLAAKIIEDAIVRQKSELP